MPSLAAKARWRSAWGRPACRSCNEAFDGRDSVSLRNFLCINILANKPAKTIASILVWQFGSSWCWSAIGHPLAGQCGFPEEAKFTPQCEVGSLVLGVAPAEYRMDLAGFVDRQLSQTRHSLNERLAKGGARSHLANSAVARDGEPMGDKPAEGGTRSGEQPKVAPTQLYAEQVHPSIWVRIAIMASSFLSPALRRRRAATKTIDDPNDHTEDE